MSNVVKFKIKVVKAAMLKDIDESIVYMSTIKEYCSSVDSKLWDESEALELCIAQKKSYDKEHNK